MRSTEERIAEAIANRDAARAAYEAPTSAAEYREADEALTFWSGKVSALLILADQEAARDERRHESRVA